MDGTIIDFFQILRTFYEIFTPSRLVSQRPHNDGRSVFISFVHIAHTIEELLGRIGRDGYEFSLFTLSVFEGELRRRLNADIAAGKREEDITERAVSYLPYFERTKGRMINTDGRTPEECAEEIAAILSGKE